MKNACADNATIDRNYEHAIFLLQQFRAKYETLEDHLRELFSMMGDLIQCSSCSSKNWQRKDGERWVRCLDCRKKYWPTADTFFHRVRNLEAWVFAIHLEDEQVNISAAAFHRLVGVSYDCAWNIFCRLRIVINSCFEEDALSARSAEFTAIIAKRSRATPAHLPPISEEEAAEAESRPQDVEESQNEAAVCDLSPYQQTLYEEISGTPIHFDVLYGRLKMDISGMNVALFNLELAGLITKLPGQLYQRKAPKRMCLLSLDSTQTEQDNVVHERILSVISSAIDFTREVFHGVSRKYLQLYLGTFWQYLDRQRWFGGALLTACLQCRYIGNEEIRQYVSPLLVSLAAA